MAIYFDVKTIREITGNKFYRQSKDFTLEEFSQYDKNNRQPREFTLEELSQYDGSNGKAAYVAVEGIVYDLSNEKTWVGGTHFGLVAGRDYTEEFKSCHGNNKVLKNLPRVGVLNHIFKEN
ncbi:cytochrome b5 domain-containing protein [Clostridium sp.]|uniref:cytochrome b5 domain-containing protein n=1 Tax=Clostridium sp. TaxID=1506 RepID=UPI0026232871|nr:cytochrome b5 domain-containing protein [Clostridium sp.]